MCKSLDTTLLYYLDLLYKSAFILLSVKCILFFSCFRNPSNSNMDYMICYVRTRLFLCVRVHTGVGHTDSAASQHNIFDSEKLEFFVFFWRDSNLGSWNLESNALAIEAPRHPVYDTNLTRTKPKRNLHRHQGWLNRPTHSAMRYPIIFRSVVQAD